MTPTPLFDAIYSSVAEIEQAEDQAQRLQQLRARFGIEEGPSLQEGQSSLEWPLFSPVLDREGGLAVRRVWCGEDDRTGYLLIEREDW